MEVQIPIFVLKIIKEFSKKGFEIYIVGGAVRDALMNKYIYDWDLATNARPQEMLDLMPNAFYDNKFGTVGITDESLERPLEITTFRTEHGYSDTRRPDRIEWGKTLEEDLKRRDFTINSLALKISNSILIGDLNKTRDSSLLTVDCKLIDLFGGERDLVNKLIRAVGDANDRFSEDALRMIRAVRIAAELGFTIEEKTLLAIKSSASLIHKIAKERVKDELLKILGSPDPFHGMVLFRESQLMAEILPELEKTFGVEQKSPQRHHIYDVGNHLLMSLKFCKTIDPIVRFATLIHDIGKPQTFKKLENGVITFYNHEVVSAGIAKNIAERLRLSGSDSEKLITLVRRHQFTVDERQTDSAIRRFIKNVGLENVEDMLILRVADRLGGGARETSWRLEEFKKRLVEVQKQPFSLNDLKIDGHDVMKVLRLSPGPKVGEILNEIFDEVVERKVENDRETLLSKLKSLHLRK